MQKIVSSLTDEEIDEIYYTQDDLRHIAWRRIVDHAAQRAIEDLPMANDSFVNSFGFGATDKYTVNRVIQRYLCWVKEGKL